MKKNISINISGIIFHIEEDGYETLRKYLDSVNKYFAAFEDNSEILADIEGRIAEIFLSKLNDGKQVITAEDVSSLIATMGSVSDFKAAEEQDFAAADTTQKEKARTTSAPVPPKRLFRDQKRKILGGVCAGLGNYFGVDPVWPRLIVALLILGTGFLLLGYIVLWIALPASNDLEEPATGRKMYRDTDKKVVAGVAAGLAAFLGIDTAVVRLLFVILTIFGGLGLVVYIVLLIVVPEAKTITEKMEMQGEPVTLSNIESSVKKGKHERDGDEESALAKIILFPFRALGALLTALGPVLRVVVDVFRVAIGIVITLTGVTMLLSLILAFGVIVGMFAAPHWGFFSDGPWNVPGIPFNTIRNSIPTWTILFAFLATFIPSLFIVLVGNSIIAGRILFRQSVGWSFFVIFFISIAVLSFSLPGLIYGFKEEGEYRTEQSFNVGGKTAVFNMRETGLDDYNVTSITLKAYEGKEIKMVERFQSQGPSRKVAGENARMITYDVTQADSVLTFDSNVTFKEDAKFRAQRLDIDVYIPYNQTFVVDAKLWRLIDTGVINHRRYHISFNEETQTWKMTDKGLICVSCPEKADDAELSANDQFGLKNFDAIDLKGLFDVRIEQGDAYAVEVKGPEDERRRYDVYVNGQTLVIEYDDNRKYFWKRNLVGADEIRINITMPTLRGLDVTGAGKLKFNGFDEETVNVKLKGAVVADGDLNAGTLDVELTGASFLELNGKGRLMEADIVGASGLRAYGYEVKHCIVEAHGASMARVNVTETLEIKKGIASSVSHRGNPEVIRR